MKPITKPIRNDQEYQEALEEADRVFQASQGTPEGDYLDLILTLIEAYESKHFEIPYPDPVDALEYVMESRGLTRKDLEPYLGSRYRVSEILNRKRSLSMEMVRKLHCGLGIPADILIQPCRTV